MTWPASCIEQMKQQVLKSACCWLRLVTVKVKLIAFIGVPLRQHFQYHPGKLVYLRNICHHLASTSSIGWCGFLQQVICVAEEDTGPSSKRRRKCCDFWARRFTAHVLEMVPCYPSCHRTTWWWLQSILSKNLTQKALNQKSLKVSKYTKPPFNRN